jgi:hypothetical protein
MTTAVEHAAVRRSGRTRARAPPAPAGGVALSHVSMYLVRAHVCMSSAQPSPPLEAPAGPQALLPT